MKMATVTQLRPGQTTPAEPGTTCAELMRLSGMNYAQVDFHCRVGRLRPLPGPAAERRFSEAETRIAVVMKELTDRGFTATAAAEYARQHVEQGRVIELQPRGLTVIGMEIGG